MNIKRIVKHLIMSERQVKSCFPADVLDFIEQEIKASETFHSGEIRFVVESALEGAPLFKDQSARARAIDVFSQLRIWDTEQNNGVLIYMLFADRDVEIIADRGIHAKVGSETWDKICHLMEGEFKQGNFKEGVTLGITSITQHLLTYFPIMPIDKNELSNKPVLI